MNSTIPKSFADLAENSVYYELLGKDFSKLDAIYDPSYFNVDADGNLVYFTPKSDGNYEHSPWGEFVQAQIPQADGSTKSVFLHYSQVFQPTLDAKKSMDLSMIVLGVIYQNSALQIAKGNSYLLEAEQLNKQLEELNRAYNAFTVGQTNVDTANKNAVVKLNYEGLKSFIDLGLTPPLDFFITGFGNRGPFLKDCASWSVLDPGASTTYTWFYIGLDQDGKLAEITIKEGYAYNSDNPPPELTQEEYENAIKNSTDDIGIFLQNDSLTLTANQNNGWFSDCTEYKKGILKENGSGYAIEDWLLYDKDKGETSATLKTAGMAERSSFDELRLGKKDMYLNFKQMQSFADTIRLSIDTKNNKLESIMTRINLANNELQQNYNIGTDTMSATEDTRRKVTSNLRS